MPSHAEPICARERLFTLDLIRGFALLGIFIMNLPGFSDSFFKNADGSHTWPHWWDTAAQTARDVLFSGKFNSMFSMLFAIGFILQLERLEARVPGQAMSIYLRRIFWLLVFGAIHQTMLWTGDVLHIYAFFGLVLLALRRAPDKLLWTLFALCLAYPIGAGVYRIATTTPQDVENTVALMKAWEASNDIAYGAGTFFSAIREHLRETRFLYTDKHQLIGMLSFYFQVFSTMLIGLVLGRRHVFQNISTHLPAVKRFQWWALGLGIATGAVFAVWENTTKNPAEPTVFRMFAYLCYSLCRLLIMAFYVATIVRAANNAWWRTKLVPIAMAGRMPLTNYLMQTVLATFIFYGWGLGLWSKTSPASNFALAVGIFFLIQIPLSCWWLGRFATGPMEFVWRLLTYGRASFDRKQVATA